MCMFNKIKGQDLNLGIWLRAHAFDHYATIFCFSDRVKKVVIRMPIAGFFNIIKHQKLTKFLPIKT